jgi:hypothetical protein
MARGLNPVNEPNYPKMAKALGATPTIRRGAPHAGQGLLAR